MTCDNKESIVGYLYDDLTEGERHAFDAHLAVCEECRSEVAGLRATRGHLSLWTPPEPDFAFRIVREQPARVLPMRRRWTAAFGLAAAAVLVLAAATSIANLEVRYDANGFVLRTGWGRGEAPAAQAEQRSNDLAIQPATATNNDFATLERRLRQLELATAATPSVPGMQAASTRMSDAEILRRVREIVTEAESRQQTAVAERLLQVVQDFDRQREADLAAIQRGLGTYQGLTNAEIAQQRDMLNQLYRVAARQER